MTEAEVEKKLILLRIGEVDKLALARELGGV